MPGGGVFGLRLRARTSLHRPRVIPLSEEWARDEQRRKRTGVPEEIEMRTKPELARGEMLGRALDGGLRVAWVVADSVYDGDTRRRLGMFLEEREQNPTC